MSHLFQEKGTPLHQQAFTWKELSLAPISKLNTDALTRIRLLLLKSSELGAIRFSLNPHQISLNSLSSAPPLFEQLTQVRRIEQDQASLLGNLIPADQSPLETAVAYEQMAIHTSLELAQIEEETVLKSHFQDAALNSCDHLYSFSSALDRVEGKDANALLQSFTEILPGKPTGKQYRSPHGCLLTPYDRNQTALSSKLHIRTLISIHLELHAFYMTVGPLYADPAVRLLFTEIASLKEQMATQYLSLLDPQESSLERWFLQEAQEVYLYSSCLETESDPRLRGIWERFLSYEQGHLTFVSELLAHTETRESHDFLSQPLRSPPLVPLQFKSHKDVLRQWILQAEKDGIIKARSDRPKEKAEERLGEKLGEKLGGKLKESLEGKLTQADVQEQGPKQSDGQGNGRESDKENSKGNSKGNAKGNAKETVEGTGLRTDQTKSPVQAQDPSQRTTEPEIADRLTSDLRIQDSPSALISSGYCWRPGTELSPLPSVNERPEKSEEAA